MDDRTVGLLRDGSLALGALGALLDRLRRRDGLGAVLDPGAALVGVGGAVAIEAAMLRHPDGTRELWERPPVRVACTLGTVVGGRALARRRGSRVLAALCWGLLAYLAMLGCVLCGRGNPVSGALGAEGDRVEEQEQEQEQERDRVAGQS